MGNMRRSFDFELFFPRTTQHFLFATAVTTVFCLAIKCIVISKNLVCGGDSEYNCKVYTVS